MAGIFTSLFGSATGGGGGGGDVSSVNGMKGAVVITGENTNATVAGETATVSSHLNTIKNNQGDLGDQVSDIEGKIPGDASDSNQLLTTAVVIKEYS